MWIIHTNCALGLTLWWSSKVAKQLNLNYRGPAFRHANRANVRYTTE